MTYDGDLLEGYIDEENAPDLMDYPFPPDDHTDASSSFEQPIEKEENENSADLSLYMHFGILPPANFQISPRSQKEASFQDNSYQSFLPPPTFKDLGITEMNQKREFPELDKVSSFTPSPPEETVKFFTSSSRCNTPFKEGFCENLTSTPYKYWLKIVSTLPKIFIKISNPNVKFDTSRTQGRMKISNFLYEYNCEFCLINYVKRGESNEFCFQVFNQFSKLIKSSRTIHLTSKKSTQEKNFWIKK